MNNKILWVWEWEALSKSRFYNFTLENFSSIACGKTKRSFVVKVIKLFLMPLKLIHSHPQQPTKTLILMHTRNMCRRLRKIARSTICSCNKGIFPPYNRWWFFMIIALPHIQTIYTFAELTSVDWAQQVALVIPS